MIRKAGSKKKDITVQLASCTAAAMHTENSVVPRTWTPDVNICLNAPEQNMT